MLIKRKDKIINKIKSIFVSYKFNKVIIDIGLLLFVLSDAYSTIVIVYGVPGIASKILIAPQAIFGIWVLLSKFIK